MQDPLSNPSGVSVAEAPASLGRAAAPIAAFNDVQSKRVLLLITTLTFGGAETQVVRLAHELKVRGWEVGIACLIRPTNWVKQLEDEGIAVYSLDMNRGVPDLRAIFRLRTLIKTFKPSIVHSHMVHANLLARFTRIFCSMPALVCTAHNLRETSEKGGPTWHKELLYRWTDFLADRTTIICHAAFDRYVQVGAVPKDKFEVVPNGVDVERFSPSLDARQIARRDLGLNDATFAWLAVGRLVEQKDYLTLLKAVQLLPEGDFVVLVAGNGPLLQSLESESARLGTNKTVRFLGAHESILNLYSAADAFVMSSVFEGLSAALLEAASMGLPAVVTDVGGNTEIVKEGETGYVVAPSNPAMLAEAMGKLMAAPAPQIAKLGTEARRQCIDIYRFEIIAARWLELYARCFASRRGKGNRKNAMVIAPAVHQ